MRRLCQPFLSQEPTAKLIRKTALQEWRLIALNLGSSLIEAVSEGATLGIVFLAVRVLSTPSGEFNWGSLKWLSWWPALTDQLNAMTPSSLFLSLLGLAVFVQAFQSFAKFLTTLSTTYFSARCRALVTSRIHNQVLSFNYPCASGYKVGDLTENINSAPEAIRTQIEVTSTLLVGGLLSITYLIVLISISPWLLIVVGIIGLVIAFLQGILLPRIRYGAREVTKAQVSVYTSITENFQGLRLLHTSGQLDIADEQLTSKVGGLESQLRRQARLMSVIGPFTSFLPILAIALLAALSLLFLGGNSSGILPKLVTFIFALQKLNSRITIMNSCLNQIAENRGRYDRLNSILTPASKIFRSKGGKPFVELRKSIRFENVTLQYEPSLEPSLSNISFTLSKGKTLALVGPSGAGKSSIADLITGLFSPSAGLISIDGEPMQHFRLDSWQQRLGVVSQDTFLFNTSIAANIAYGTPNATEDDIKSACLTAQATGFIEALPASYETIVGERGYRLSGGQRQRLSLARAILRDPDLLILDEATSALDSQSERLVQEAIEKFECHHTVLVIAHRLSTIVNADEILVLDKGHIVQSGSHETLLKQAGLYRDLWMHQNPSV